MKHVEVRRGSYVDSVSLMQVSRRVADLDGVTAALVAMATDLNLELADGMGFDVPPGTSGNEMLVALDVSEDVLEPARAEVDAALSAASRPASSSGFGAAPEPLTVRAAVRDLDPATSVALISTPGQYAFGDALDAVEAGLMTMVFSDNVSLAQEVALKRRAAETGALVMGPDCGTAVVGGVGLGFANVVRPGPVGIVAASGTGAQHLLALLDGAGVGVAHCLGVGGRDLKAAVGGLSTVAALDLLDADAATELIVVVSKPPDDDVAAAVRSHAEALSTPVLFGLLGPGQPDLTETAASVVAAVGGSWTSPEHWSGRVSTSRDGGSLVGLFVGGTMRDEATIIAEKALGAGLEMVDFGDDDLTRGRPHPMIDGSLRIDRISACIDDASVGVLLLDVVLGLGSDPDPAASLAEPLRRATQARLPVVVSVVGTRDDPQDLRRQCAALTDAGAAVHLSNA
ncbi:MAG: FdrA family protein, partial [Nocardioides sp.]